LVSGSVQEAAPALLDVRIPEFSYGGPVVLQRIELRAAEPGLIALVGPNGSGKSTLLRILAGLLSCRGAEVRIQGLPLGTMRPREIAERVAWVPQRSETAEGMTVREMVRIGRFRVERPLRPLPDMEERRITNVLADTGLTALADREAGSLSGGEHQRAVLARVLVQETPVLVLDEPIASLDLRFQEEVYERLRRLSRGGRLVLVSDHHVELAADYADRLLLLRDGAVRADGPAREVLTRESIREVFGVERQLFPDPVSGSPRLARPARSSANGTP
jgi:iron complex transport system ATP-binding protein